eukprot:CAMPEP_0182937564 /NCGR_PEP_ID=MMETSP0105_2-20130417/42289_1 /TAXON_ID=81532 ORGANISM="Acanthoeca-like sp., Strain 10tr" /NCGR_SAMPLE_ID=MMETSP0105_2 /ASSEMBLY_ACC=CAM_ASM_000205 /LENGTH=93 /DNA_ID=CAMNT_0025076779 /DNA_START=408 /DNA_END=689 /DNA_ORIENTATION=-
MTCCSTTIRKMLVRLWLTWGDTRTSFSTTLDAWVSDEQSQTCLRQILHTSHRRDSLRLAECTAEESLASAKSPAVRSSSMIGVSSNALLRSLR